MKLVFVDGQLFEPAAEERRDSPRADRPEAKTESEAKPAEIVFAGLPAPTGAGLLERLSPLWVEPCSPSDLRQRLRRERF